MKKYTILPFLICFGCASNIHRFKAVRTNNTTALTDLKTKKVYTLDTLLKPNIYWLDVTKLKLR